MIQMTTASRSKRFFSTGADSVELTGQVKYLEILETRKTSGIQSGF